MESDDHAGDKAEDGLREASRLHAGVVNAAQQLLLYCQFAIDLGKDEAPRLHAGIVPAA